jgi:hypothetical protein
MPSTDTKPELTAKASMAQPVSQPAVYANGLKICETGNTWFLVSRFTDPGVLAFYGLGFQLHDFWDCGFETHLISGLSSFVFVVCRVSGGLCDTLITRSEEGYPMRVSLYAM